jgi:hydroxymethylpyrimidine/phosphomethylpyrimidine kinase
MLYSPGIIRIVAQSLRSRRIPLVVDPVMISTSGTKLLTRSALDILARDLLPLATLLTPNVDEAEVLCGQSIRSAEDLRWAAKQLHSRFRTAVLVKGGHLSGMPQAVDIFYDGTEELLLSAPFVHGVSTHGTGCTFSAAITAFLAAGFPLANSVIRAKEFITRAIADSQRAGQHWILNQAGVNSASRGLATRLRHRLRG